MNNNKIKRLEKELKKELEKEVKNLKREKEICIKERNFKKASIIREKISVIRGKIDILRDKNNNKIKTNEPIIPIDYESLESIFCKSGIVNVGIGCCKTETKERLKYATQRALRKLKDQKVNLNNVKHAIIMFTVDRDIIVTDMRHQLFNFMKKLNQKDSSVIMGCRLEKDKKYFAKVIIITMM